MKTWLKNKVISSATTILWCSDLSKIYTFYKIDSTDFCIRNKNLSILYKCVFIHLQNELKLAKTRAITTNQKFRQHKWQQTIIKTVQTLSYRERLNTEHTKFRCFNFFLRSSKLLHSSLSPKEKKKTYRMSLIQNNRKIKTWHQKFLCF